MPASQRDLPSLIYLIHSVYGEQRWQDTEWVVNRAHLAGTNDQVDELNAAVAALFPGEEFVCLSADWAEGEAGEVDHPVEFLNTITP